MTRHVTSGIQTKSTVAYIARISFAQTEEGIEVHVGFTAVIRYYIPITKGIF